MRLLKKVTLALFLAFGITLLALYLIMGGIQESGDKLVDARKEAPGQFIALPDGITHYSYVKGDSSKKTIVLVTGGGITGMEVYKNQTQYFADQGYSVLSYDLYGRGYSDRPALKNTPELLERQLTLLIDSLGISKPFDMVAMSFGAIMALDYNTHHPGAIEKLVLLDPTATGEYKISKLLTVPVLTPFVMTVYWYPRAVENQRKEFVNQEMFDAYTGRLNYFMNIKGYKKMTLDTWNFILNQNRLSLLKNFPANKVLVLFGEKDPYFPAGNIPVFETVYPTLKSKMIPATGHMPQYEKPEVVNPMIVQFFESGFAG